ncbi:MAG: TonB-dependent receptor [Opitutus sp.]|nr:TonB-dependent receptor [Opitutus sp.]
MTCPLPARFAGRLFLVSLTALAAGSFAAAQEAVAEFDTLVVAATRTPVPIAQLGMAADVISGNDLLDRQVPSLAMALSLVPSTPTTATGAYGAATSLFLRGSESNHTLFLVDGIRFNDANTDYFNFLSGSQIGPHERIEIVRGPQSTLHGGEAVGGVISIEQIPGSGPASGSFAVEAGSFGSISSRVSVAGSNGATGYNFSAFGGHTDNDRPDNSFNRGGFALRLDRTVSEQLKIGATARGYVGDYDSPGDLVTNDPNNSERDRIGLATVFAEFTPTPDWVLRATLGVEHRQQVSDNPAPNPPWNDPASHDTTTNRRGVIDAQATWSGLANHRITFGTTTEWSDTRSDGFGDIDENQTLFAVFAQDEITLCKELFLTLGLRNDDHDTFGHATTGRATIAWLALPGRLKLRSSYGTAFRSPSFLDLYGKDAYYVGNPDLESERARGWDAGFDVTLPRNLGSVSVTWFDIRYDDLIAYDFSVYPSTVRNISDARTYGVEIASRINLSGAASLQLAYTWLEAEDSAANTRLLRRPRHSLVADVWYKLTRSVSVGAGVALASERQDVSSVTYLTIDAEDYTVARLYAAWRVNDRLSLKARLENALDERYEPAHGFPALPRAAYGSVEWRF